MPKTKKISIKNIFIDLKNMTQENINYFLIVKTITNVNSNSLKNN